MPTFKVVVIGASGVGKTSLRGQYISSRFSTSYRATIGADFITKTLPAPTPSSEPITLQIWDTAGQERFSSLASAFFRGADAAVLMYDVTAPETLYALSKWWAEFKEKAPVREEEVRGFCVVVVGNKTDLLEGREDGDPVVSPAQGARFVRALVPRPDTPPPSPGPSKLTLAADDGAEDSDEEGDDALASSELTARPGPVPARRALDPPSPISILRRPHPSPTHRKTHSSQSQVAFSHPPSPSALLGTRARNKSSSRASSHSRYGGGASTVTSTLTIYHTPSSSVFSDGASEYYHSAQSSWHESGLHSHRHSLAQSDLGNGFPPRLNGNGNGNTADASDSPSARSVSEATITPARFASASSSTDELNAANGHSRESSTSTAAETATTSNTTSDTDTSSRATSPSSADGKSPTPARPALDTTFSQSQSNHSHSGPQSAGPSSSALSPLPYPQHFPFGAQSLSFGAAANGNPNVERNGGWGSMRAPPGGWGSVKAVKAPGPGGGSGFGAFSPPTAAATTALANLSASAGSSADSLSGTAGAGVNGKAAAHAHSTTLSTSTSASSAPTTSTLSGSTDAPAPLWLAEPDLPSSNVGAAHFRVSARTGAGVGDVFGWVARRLVHLAREREGEMGFDDATFSRHKGGRGGRGGGGAEERLRLNAGMGEGGKNGGCC